MSTDKQFIEEQLLSAWKEYSRYMVHASEQVDSLICDQFMSMMTEELAMKMAQEYADKKWKVQIYKIDPLYGFNGKYTKMYLPHKYNLRSVRKPSAKAKELIDLWANHWTLRAMCYGSDAEYNEMVRICRYIVNTTGYTPAEGWFRDPREEGPL